MSMLRALALATLICAPLAGCGDPKPATGAPAPGPVAPRTLAYCPVEDLARGWSLKLKPEPDGQRVIVSGDGRELICCAGFRSVLIDGAPHRMEAPAEIRDGRLMVPTSLQGAAERAWGTRPAPAVVAAVPAAKGWRVVVDPGHGGLLTGAEGVTGLLEKDVVLSISKLLKEELEARGIEVVMTRETDRDFLPAHLKRAAYNVQQKADLEERSRRANAAQPDLFVSMHANWAPSPDAEGFEVYYPRDPSVIPPAPSERPSRRPTFDWSAYGSDTPRILDRLAMGDREDRRWKCCRDLAESVRGTMEDKLSTPDRGAKMADHKVTRTSTAPAVLVEAGFLSNPDEERRLRNLDYQRQVAKAVADGILRYLARQAPRKP